MPDPYRTWVEVSRSALLWNFRQFQRFFRHRVLIAPVVKANAYGHGTSWVVQKLDRAQIWGFGVAYDTEARELLPASRGLPILVLSAWQHDSLPWLIKKKIRLVVWDRRAAAAVARAARAVGQRAFVHVKVDTGTSRIGTRPENLSTLGNYLKKNSAYLFVEGIFSHYADSESQNLGEAALQRELFISAARRLSIHAPLTHMACTAASLRLPLEGTNLVRPGIGLYGLWPSKTTEGSVHGILLKPVLSWKTRLLQTKRLPAGTTIGYDRTFRLQRPTTIGILPIGYADGYDRRASNRSFVVIRGRPFPVIGRVSMNLTVIDLGRPSSVQPGTEVTLIGRGVSAADLARLWGTIHYEVVSRIHSSIPRREIP